MTEETLTLKNILSTLKQESSEIPSNFAKYFSDLSPIDLKQFHETWGSLSLARRLELIEFLNQQYEQDTRLAFDELAISLFQDSEADVRAAAVRLLTESENIDLIEPLLDILNLDEQDAPRVAAAEALRQYVEMGELEELPDWLYKRILDSLLLASASSNIPALQRAVIESIGYAERPDVEALLANAYKHQDRAWVASALIGMGRSANPRWQDEIIESLANPNPAVRLAAVNAASGLHLAEARSILLGMLEDEEEEEVLRAVIWTLSSIGGEDVRTYLEALLDQTEDDDLLTYIDEALANLAFTEEMEGFELLAFDPDDELEEIDLDQEDEEKDN